MKRLYWIFVAFVTRPQAWILAAILVGLLIAAVHFQNDRHTDIDLPIVSADLPIINSKTQLESYSDHSGPVQIRLSRLTSDDRDQLFAKKRTEQNPNAVTTDELQQLVSGYLDLDFPPNVETVDAGSLANEFWPLLREMQSLKRLRLSSGSFDVTRLTKLQNLEVLDLGTMHSIPSLAPLRQLTKLHTLRIGHNGLVTAKHMAEVAKIPSLRKLILPDVTKFDFALAAISKLEESDSLESISVPVLMSESETLSSIQSQVPNIDVQSNRYVHYRLLSIVVAIWLALACGMLGIHFVGQFSMPHAQLTPGYKQAHHVAYWMFLVGMGVLVSTTVCFFTGADWFSVFALLFVVLLLSVRPSKVFAGRAAAPSRLQRALFALGFVGCICAIVGAIRYPMVLESYVMGAFPIATASLAIIAVVLAFSNSVRLHRLCRQRYASGMPLVLSMKDLQKVLTDTGLPGQKEQAVGKDPHERNAEFAWFLSAVLVVAVLIRHFWGDSLGTRGPGAMLQGMAVFGGGYIAFLVMLFIAIKWWQRMPYLAQMFTRPPRRAAQVNYVIEGVRKDFVVYLIPALIAALIVAVTAPFWPPGNMIYRVIATALFFTGVAMICYVSVLWGLIVRRVRSLFIMVIFLQFAVPISVGVLTVAGIDFSMGIPPYRVVITSLVMIGLSAFAVSRVRRKYNRFEWGTLL